MRLAMAALFMGLVMVATGSQEKEHLCVSEVMNATDADFCKYGWWEPRAAGQGSWEDISRTRSTSS